MRLPLRALALVAALGLIGLSASLAASAQPGPTSTALPARLEPLASGTEVYEVDPIHSNVLFKIKHNYASWFYGRFDEIAGTFVVNEEDPDRCELEVEVKTGSVDTRSEKLNGHLRSPDFFNAAEFPTVRFESRQVESAGEDRFAATGDLTLHGVTKEVTIEIEKTGESASRDGKVIGFHAVFTIDRSDYGMEYGTNAGLGAEVELIVSIEARKTEQR